MNDFDKFDGDLLRAELIKVKTEEEAKDLFLKLKPQLDLLSERFFSEDVSVSDADEDDIDWVNMLSEYIINTIQLYLHYHVKGELKHIRFSLSEQSPPNITLIIGEQAYNIDFDEFKNGTDENNRDAHRECYFRNESIWGEYKMFSTNFDINATGTGLCIKLKEVFPLVTLDYIVT